MSKGRWMAKNQIQKKDHKMDIAGIDPATSRMRSGRSTIWAKRPKQQPLNPYANTIQHTIHLLLCSCRRATTWHDYTHIHKHTLFTHHMSCFDKYAHSPTFSSQPHLWVPLGYMTKCCSTNELYDVLTSWLWARGQAYVKRKMNGKESNPKEGP